MNPSGKVQLVFANIPRNILVPLVSRNVDDILCGIKKLMSTLLVSLILPIFSWPLMGLSCYFT